MSDYNKNIISIIEYTQPAKNQNSPFSLNTPRIDHIEQMIKTCLPISNKILFMSDGNDFLQFQNVYKTLIVTGCNKIY